MMIYQIQFNALIDDVHVLIAKCIWMEMCIYIYVIMGIMFDVKYMEITNSVILAQLTP